MRYRDYVAHVEFDDEAGIFHGEVVNTRDVITFQGTSVSELRAAFKDSVDDYLVFCKEQGEEPDRPFSGKFIVRVSDDVHRSIYVAAKKTGKSLNAWVIDVLDKAASESFPVPGKWTRTSLDEIKALLLGVKEAIRPMHVFQPLQTLPYVGMSWVEHSLPGVNFISCVATTELVSHEPEEVIRSGMKISTNQQTQIN